jgi:hypothetical protein
MEMVIQTQTQTPKLGHAMELVSGHHLGIIELEIE